MGKGIRGVGRREGTKEDFQPWIGWWDALNLSQCKMHHILHLHAFLCWYRSLFAREDSPCTGPVCSKDLQVFLRSQSGLPLHLASEIPILSRHHANKHYLSLSETGGQQQQKIHRSSGQSTGRSPLHTSLDDLVQLGLENDGRRTKEQRDGASRPTGATAAYSTCWGGLCARHSPSA